MFNLYIQCIVNSNNITMCFTLTLVDLYIKMKRRTRLQEKVSLQSFLKEHDWYTNGCERARFLLNLLNFRFLNIKATKVKENQ